MEADQDSSVSQGAASTDESVSSPPREMSQITPMDTTSKLDRKKEVLKLLLLAVVAFIVFTIFSTWPSIYTAVLGVATIVTVAKLTEWMSVKAERYPGKNRAVVITGCDTGNIAHI